MVRLRYEDVHLPAIVWFGEILARGLPSSFVSFGESLTLGQAASIACCFRIWSPRTPPSAATREQKRLPSRHGLESSSSLSSSPAQGFAIGLLPMGSDFQAIPIIGMHPYLAGLPSSPVTTGLFRSKIVGIKCLMLEFVGSIRRMYPCFRVVLAKVPLVRRLYILSKSVWALKLGAFGMKIIYILF